jgi:hypothetical protein
LRRKTEVCGEDPGGGDERQEPSHGQQQSQDSVSKLHGQREMTDGAAEK